MSTTLPTVETFRTVKTNSVPTSGSNARQKANILALSKSYTVEQIARKTYPGTFPIATARQTSPEGDATVDSRLMAKWNNYLAFVQQTIDESKQ